MGTDRELIVKWWAEAFDHGLWAAAWSKSLEGLTAEQAVWRPSPEAGTRELHSIHQIVLHMIFWRESWLRRVASGQKPTAEEIAERNFPEVNEHSDPAWSATRARFAETQALLARAFADPATQTDALAYLLPHDCYHFGQINLLRAMLGLAVIE